MGASCGELVAIEVSVEDSNAPAAASLERVRVRMAMVEALTGDDVEISELKPLDARACDAPATPLDWSAGTLRALPPLADPACRGKTIRMAHEQPAVAVALYLPAGLHCTHDWPLRQNACATAAASLLVCPPSHPVCAGAQAFGRHADGAAGLVHGRCTSDNLVAHSKTWVTYPDSYENGQPYDLPFGNQPSVGVAARYALQMRTVDNVLSATTPGALQGQVARMLARRYQGGATVHYKNLS